MSNRLQHQRQKITSLQVLEKTSRGMRRTKNEDYTLCDRVHRIFIVADGMGGHRCGEVASALAVRRAHETLVAGLERSGDTDFPSLIFEAIQAAHEEVKLAATAARERSGMGTTLLVLLVADGRGYLGHIGDSRAYLLRDELVQLTTDQTVGQRIVNSSQGPVDEAARFRMHVLTQAVGLTDILEPEFAELDLHPNDTLLLCTDGLTDMLSDTLITNTLLEKGGDPEAAASELIVRANACGGKDNISLLLVSCQ